MNATKTVTVRLQHNSSLPNSRWCEPVGWEPKNEIEGAEYQDGSWWDEYENVAGLVWFGHPDAYGANEKIEASLEDLRVVSCPDCRIVGEVELD